MREEKKDTAMEKVTRISWKISNMILKNHQPKTKTNIIFYLELSNIGEMFEIIDYYNMKLNFNKIYKTDVNSNLWRKTPRKLYGHNIICLEII